MFEPMSIRDGALVGIGFFVLAMFYSKLTQIAALLIDIRRDAAKVRHLADTEYHKRTGERIPAPDP